MDTFITYEGLPINSGGAHSLGKKSADKIYSDTTSFLKTFTNCFNPKVINLVFYSSQKGTYKTLPILWSLTKQLGIPSYEKWDLGSVTQHFYTWKIKPNNIKKGFDILEEYRHLPENQFGPITLSFLWHFYFIDTLSKEPLPHQDKIPSIDIRHTNSQLYLRLGQKSTISAWFAFPFDSLNEKNLNYIGALTKALPFKPSDKHWRLWKLSKKGNWIPRALDINAS